MSKYKIIINNISEKPFSYKYTFSKNNILIKIYGDALSIETDIGEDYTANQILSTNSYLLFPDAVKKALLLFVMKNSQNLRIWKTCVIKDDKILEEKILRKDEHPFVQSMIFDKLQDNDCLNNWSNNEINGLLKLSKSKYDQRIAALFAFIISQNKVLETDRFIYLWMSFNGMYGYLSSFVPLHSEEKRHSEQKQLYYIQRYYDLGREKNFSSDNRKCIAKKLIDFLKESPEKVINKKSLESNTNKELCDKIQSLLAMGNCPKKVIDITVYGYLLIYFSYYFRCNIIHGNQPVDLFSYRDDINVKCLKIINGLLQEFIYNNLHKWFDDVYVSNLENKIKTLKLS